MKIILPFTLLLLVIMSSCQKEEERADPPCRVSYSVKQGEEKEFNGSWKFIGFQTKGGDQLEYPPCIAYDNNPNYRIIITFDGGVYTGAVLNRFEGFYTVNNDQISTGEAEVSSSLLEPSELLSYESRLIKAIETATEFSMYYNIMTVYYGDSGESLLFEAIETGEE
ncbi:hypothetical protein RCC89_02765 [Cytophagaceae bacterium ABcell3]|nr:hypothetical protein RCC89_02765 [Cytophagaceae bacterium ABcell3]